MAATRNKDCCVTIEPGELTKQIRLESPELNSSDEQTGVWNLEAKMWAKIDPFGGSELFLALQPTPHVTHRVTTHYLAGVMPTWRIVYGSRILQIDRVINPMEANVKLEFLCIENPQETV